MSPAEIKELHAAMLKNYRVGQTVRALVTVGDSPDGDSPGGIYTRPGELLVVRRIEVGSDWPLYVSHPEITDSSFRVGVNEVEPVEASHE